MYNAYFASYLAYQPLNLRNVCCKVDIAGTSCWLRKTATWLRSLCSCHFCEMAALASAMACPIGRSICDQSQCFGEPCIIPVRTTSRLYRTSSLYFSGRAPLISETSWPLAITSVCMPTPTINMH